MRDKPLRCVLPGPQLPLCKGLL